MKENTYLETLDCYIPAFVEEMVDRLAEKLPEKGDKWKELSVFATEEVDHQNIRFFNWFKEKLDAWEREDGDINWVDVANEALICWVRENDPQ